MTSCFLIVLVVVMALSASSCKSGKKDNSDASSTTLDTKVPGGYSDVSAEVLEALSNSGDVNVWFLCSELTEQHNEFIQYFEDVYGGTIHPTCVPWEGSEREFITKFEAGEAPDVCNIFSKLWPKVANRGIIYSLPELEKMGVLGIDHPALQEYKPAVDYYSYKGESYCVYYALNWGVFCYSNEDLFDQYEIKSPWDYFQEGKWDYDALYKCCEQICKATDLGNGTYGVMGYGGWDASLFVTANGGDLIVLEDDGTLRNGIRDPKTVRGLENIKKIFNDGYAVSDLKQLFGNSQLAVMSALPYNFLGHVSKFRDEDGKLPFEFAVVPFPYGKDNTDGRIPGGSGGMGVVTSTKNPQGAVNYIIAQAYYLQGHYDAQSWHDHIIEDSGKELFTLDQCKIIFDYAEHAVDPVFYGVASMWDAQWNFWNSVRGKGSTVAQCIESFEGLVEAQVETENDNAAQ